MSRRVRIRGFLVSALVLAALLGWGFAGLPDFGHFAGEYAQLLNRVATGERHATNVVTSIVFDYRGVDTMGEEFILFAAVITVGMLLRETRDEGRRAPRDEVRSDAIRLFGVSMVGATVLLGLSIVAHGTITPGGGFQGGVVCASGLALVYAAGSYRAYRAAGPYEFLELGESTGAGGYVAIGLAGLAAGSALLANVLPLGTAGELNSAGTITMLNAGVGLEVSAALVLLFHEFLEEVEHR
ncbi:MAG: sodium:proton antiporter [Actinobacteria bacterium]|nr:MAG: sodium:proton antiporter [Actinomycetota bacterium]